MTRTDDAVFQQYGALPFSIADDGAIKVLLVTTRGRREWIIPKGWPIRNLSPSATAAREAYEEAGLLGTMVSDDPIGSFRYAKQRNSRKETIHEVYVFLFAVKRQLRKWPEKAERMTKWFAPEEASSVVGPEGLSALLLRSGDEVLRLSHGNPRGHISAARTVG